MRPQLFRDLFTRWLWFSLGGPKPTRPVLLLCTFSFRLLPGRLTTDPTRFFNLRRRGRSAGSALRVSEGEWCPVEKALLERVGLNDHNSLKYKKVCIVLNGTMST